MNHVPGSDADDAAAAAASAAAAAVVHSSISCSSKHFCGLSALMLLHLKETARKNINEQIIDS